MYGWFCLERKNCVQSGDLTRFRGRVLQSILSWVIFILLFFCTQLSLVYPDDVVLRRLMMMMYVIYPPFYYCACLFACFIIIFVFGKGKKRSEKNWLSPVAIIRALFRRCKHKFLFRILVSSLIYYDRDKNVVQRSTTRFFSLVSFWCAFLLCVTRWRRLILMMRWDLNKGLHG